MIIGFVLAGLSLQHPSICLPQCLPQRVFWLRSGREIFNKSLRHKRKCNSPPIVVRSTPESGHGSEHSGCPLWGAWANRPSRREIVREICGVKNCTQHDKCVTCIGRANAIIGLFEGRRVR